MCSPAQVLLWALEMGSLLGEPSVIFLCFTSVGWKKSGVLLESWDIPWPLYSLSFKTIWNVYHYPSMLGGMGTARKETVT
jgi:hypothetical protein